MTRKQTASHEGAQCMTHIKPHYRFEWPEINPVLLKIYLEGWWCFGIFFLILKVFPHWEDGTSDLVDSPGLKIENNVLDVGADCEREGPAIGLVWIEGTERMSEISIWSEGKIMNWPNYPECGMKLENKHYTEEIIKATMLDYTRPTKMSLSYLACITNIIWSRYWWTAPLNTFLKNSMKFQKQFEKMCRMTRLEIGLRGNDRRMTVLILATASFQYPSPAGLGKNVTT